MKNSFTKYHSCFTLFLVAVLLMVACATEKPEPVTIRETIVVESPAIVIVTQPPVMVEVEVTRIIEIPVTAITEKPIATLASTPILDETLGPTFFEPHPYGNYTNIQEVDEIARVVLTKDTNALRELLRFQSWPCIHKNDPWGPICNDDEPIGTEVEAFGYGYCEGFGTRDEEVIMSVLEELVARTTGVYAIYEEFADESYGIVFTSIDNVNAITVLVEDDGISWVLFGCGQTPDEILGQRDVNIILPPISTATSNGSE
jgi:hypothetical protein